MDLASDSESLGTFDFSIRLGLTFIVQIAFLSSLAVIFTFLRIFYLAQSVHTRRSGHGCRKRDLLTHPMTIQFLNLLLFDLIQAIGAMLNIRWIVHAAVHSGTLCTVQGLLKQVGDVGVALSTTTIAISTFAILVLKMDITPFYSRLMISAIYIILAILLAIAFFRRSVGQAGHLYSDTGYWCWISDEYAVERIVLEYLWLWLAATLDLLCYGCMIFTLRRNLVLNNSHVEVHLRDKVHRRKDKLNNIAWHMSLYPLVYLACITPISICRFLQFGDTPVPYQATFFASMLFSASGLFNSFLFIFTRPSLSLRPGD